MPGIRRSSRLRPALIGGVALAALAASAGWQPSWKGLAFEGPGGRLEIGAVRFESSLLGAAFAQAPGDVTLTDLTFAAAGVTYRLPRVTFSGVSLSRDELARLLDPNGTEPAAQRLGRLDARQVTIPELVAEQIVAGGRTVTTYRDVVLRDVAGGRVGSATAPSGTLASQGPHTPSGTYGALTAADVDVAGIVALYGERAGATPAPFRRLYGAVTMQDMVLRDPNGVEVKLARGEIRDVQGRPTPNSWGETLKLLSEVRPQDKPTPEESARLIASMADMLDAFEVGGAELTGLSVRDPRKAGTEVRIARLAYAGAAGGRRSEARAEGVEVAAPEGRVGIGSFSATGFSSGSSFRALAELAGKKPETFDAADLRRLVPQLGTIRLQDVSLEGKDPSAPAGAQAPMRYSLRALELTADRQVNAIPTNIRYSIDGLALTLPAETTDAGLKNLIDLGYRNLDISMTVMGAWEESSNEIALQEVSLRGVNMGSVVMRGTLGNVGREVFDPDSAAATVALLGATAKNVSVVIENGGLFENLLAAEARRQGKPADAIRREYATAASLGIPALLGNSAASKQVAQAVARFVAAPKRLTISVRSKEPAGLGFADFAALGQPSDIVDRLDVTAVAD